MSGCVSKVQQQHNSSSSIDPDRYQCRCIITPVNLLKMVSEPALLGWVLRLDMLCGADHITWGRTHAGNGNVMVTYFLRTTCRKFDGDNFLRTSYFIIPGIPGTLYLELRSRLRTYWYSVNFLILVLVHCYWRTLRVRVRTALLLLRELAAVYEKLFHYSYVQAYTCACPEERTYIFF